MNKHRSLVFLALAALTVCYGCASPQASVTDDSGFEGDRSAEAATQSDASLADTVRYPLIPWPQQLNRRTGAFELDEDTRILVSDPQNQKALRAAEQLASLVRNAAVLPMRVGSFNQQADSSEPPANTISFLLTQGGDSVKEEEGRYQLEVTSRTVVVRAPTSKGLFYGMQTLRQLLPPQVETGLGYDDGQLDWSIPAVEIKDAPRFSYRGMHLDVGRHFFPVSFIKKYIDLLALHKLDTFHWHLTEDQGWRIEIEQYPRLTKVGGCRDSTAVGPYGSGMFDGVEYCGYYSQEEIREVVRYAQARHVTIIPEIEMPGHSSAALAAYPELGCTGEPIAVKSTWGVHEDIYCPKEKTFTFLKNVLTEVMELFPSKYIHIGGDEAPKAQWEQSEIAQDLMRHEGLEDEEELQSYFIRRIEDFLNEHGRRLIGWDEILQGGLAPDATVMSWRGTEGGIQAARQGHDAIMTPNGRLYFDHYQADPDTEPLAFGGLTTLRDVYAYDPAPDTLSSNVKRHIIGAQANLWTEYINTPDKAEYMAYPRALALAEVVWSPQAKRDWKYFRARLSAHLRRLEALGVNYRPPAFATEDRK